MTIDWIDHVVVPVKSLEEAASAYERLGLKLTPVTRHAGLGTENRVFMVGNGENDFFVELLGIHDREASLRNSRGAIYQKAMDEGLGIARLLLGSDDIAGTVAGINRRGHNIEIEAVSREGGAKLCDVAPLEAVPGLGITTGLVQYVQPRAGSHERRAKDGRFHHNFPLKRLDHLAAMAPNLDETVRAWGDELGVGVAGEVRGPGMIIKQLKIGDAMLELLGPDGPESPMASRPPGIASMCAWEVPNVDEAVALARERGFTPSDPRDGILPGTRVSTIPGAELAGVGMQLLQYV